MEIEKVLEEYYKGRHLMYPENKMTKEEALTRILGLMEKEKNEKEKKISK